MLDMTYGEFKQVLEAQGNRDFYLPLAAQIRAYTNRYLLEDDTTEDAYRRFFELVERDTKIYWKLPESHEADSPSLYSSRIESIRKKRASFKRTVSVYYWFHQSDERADYADRIDREAFAMSFTELAEVWRGGSKSVVASHENGLLVDLGPITLCFGRHADQIEPRLDWKERSAIVENGVPNYFAALGWKHRLVDDLVGRDSDKKAVLSWVRDRDKTATARIISGPGGAGKTRLAAEVAKEIGNKGWSAGFLPMDLSRHPMISVSEKGLLLIIDYPEERSEQVEHILRDLQSTYPKPIRILLLSRLTASERRGRPATYLSQLEEIPLKQTAGLDDPKATELVCVAAASFAGLMSAELPSLDGAEEWVRRHYTHRFPLFAMAAGIHAVLDKAGAFELGGGELMLELAERELRRVRAAWRTLDRDGERALERLLALGLFTGEGLSEDLIRELADRDIGTGLSGKRLIDAIRKTSWWRADEKRLARLEPDKPAAAFLAIALINDDAADLPKWIVGPASSAGAKFGETLSRLMFDLSDLPGEVCTTLEEKSLEMLRAYPDSIDAFEELSMEGATAYSAFFGATICRYLLQRGCELEREGGLLLSLSSLLGVLGEYDEGLFAAEAAVAARRRHTGASTHVANAQLAKALVNYGAALLAKGQQTDAFAAASEAIEILRGLGGAQSGEFAHLLAGALNNLGRLLGDLGYQDKAVGTIEEASTIYRALADADPESFYPDLAMSLSNYSALLFEVGRYEEALSNSEEALDLYKGLAASRPDKFLPELAGSVLNTGAILSEVGRYEDSFEAASKALSIYRKLAANRASAFKFELAKCLRNASMALSKLERRDKALEFAIEGVALYKNLAEVHPDASKTDLAVSLRGMRRILSALGRHEEAAEVAKETCQIYEELSGKDPSKYLPLLALSYSSLANQLWDAGSHGEIIDANVKSIEIYSKFIVGRPDLRPQLASALCNLGSALSSTGKGSEAVNVVCQAVNIYRDLAASFPNSFRKELASALEILQELFYSVDLHREALAISKEEIVVRQWILEEPTSGGLMDLGDALSRLASCFARVGNFDEAIDATDKSLAVLRNLVGIQADTFEPLLGLAHTNVSEFYYSYGLKDRAINSIRDSIDIYSKLAFENPPKFEPLLANSNYILSYQLCGIHKYDGALVSAESAVRIFLPYYLRDKEVHSGLFSLFGRVYLECCGKLSVDPDESLLLHIGEDKQSNELGSDTGDGS